VGFPTGQVALTKTLFFCHCVFDESNDSHKNGSAYAAAGDVAQYGAQVQRTAAGRRTSHDGLKERSPKAATDNSCDRIPRCAEAVLFHGCAGNVAADCSADQFNYKANYIHSLGF
jgi:hypothetical protein